MATVPSSGSGIRPHHTHFGSTPIIGYPESTGSTFSAGDLVQLSTVATNSHRVIQASSVSTGYVGVAAADASSVQDQMVPVYVAEANQRFIGWYKSTIASSLLVGAFRSFERDTTLGIDYLNDESTAANQRVQITKVGLQDIAGGPYDIGTTGGYVEFRFLPEFTAFGKTT